MPDTKKVRRAEVKPNFHRRTLHIMNEEQPYFFDLSGWAIILQEVISFVKSTLPFWISD